METQKKYQVFVSSTFEDLQEERQEVIHALLELDYIPSGMELFPAANEDQWSLIKGVIDDCDYYILIVGGRYGSIGQKGLSYTEMEYRYALEKNKPVIAFLHKDPNNISVKKSEANKEGQAKLKEFRELAQQKMCKFWENPKDLGSVVSRSIINLQKKHPSVGWVKGNSLSSKDAEIQILKLKQEIELLKTSKVKESAVIEDALKYAQGDDKVNLQYRFESRSSDGVKASWNHDINLTWNEIFTGFCLQ